VGIRKKQYVFYEYNGLQTIVQISQKETKTSLDLAFATEGVGRKMRTVPSVAPALGK